MRILGRYILPRPTRKRVSWKAEKRVVYSADIGGDERFWSLWIDDMVDRQVEAVVFLFDHRAMEGGDAAIQAVGGFKYLVDALIHKQYRYRGFKTWWRGKKYSTVTMDEVKKAGFNTLAEYNRSKQSKGGKAAGQKGSKNLSKKKPSRSSDFRRKGSM